MATAIDNTIDVEFAKRVLKLATDRAVPPIPLRLDTKLEKHWGTAHLMGVSSNSLFIRPTSSHHGGKLEKADPKDTRIWVGKLSADQQQIIHQVREEIETENLMRQTHKDHKADAQSNGHIEPTEAIEVEQDTQLVQTQINTQEEDQHFAEKLAALVSLRREISHSTSSNSAHKYLRSIRKNYDDALSLVESARQELLEAVGVIKDIGTDIPEDILAGLDIKVPKTRVVAPIEPAKTSGTGVLSKGKLIQLQEAPLADGHSWDRKKSAQYEKQIMDYMKTRPNEMVKAREIADAIGFVSKRPSDIIGPLVEKGLLKQFGNKAGTRYRLNHAELEPVDPFATKGHR